MVSMIHTQIMVDTGQRMVFDLRARLFAHLQALDMRHHDSVSAGDAVYRIDADAYCIDNLVMKGLFPLGSAALTLVVMLAVLIRLDSTLALLALCVVPFLYWVLRVYTTPLGDRAERVKELESTLGERLYEKFAAIRVVKSFAPRARTSRSVSARGRWKRCASAIRLTWQESLFSVAITGVTMIGTSLVLLVGGLHVLRGELTVGSLLVVIAYLGSVYGPLSAIAHTAGSLQEALASTRRVRRTLALIPEETDTADERGYNPARVRGHVVFDHVTFGYDGHAPVLQDVSFEARPGEMVALVGLTGAGKTTAVSMIPRFYDPSAGRVLIDGHDVREYHLRSLRERIALVLQEPVLFRGTIAENIRYGRLDATQRGDPPGRDRRARGRVRQPSGSGLRDRGGRIGQRPVGRRASAPVDRAGRPEGRADPDPRRADVVARRDLGRDRVLGAEAAARRTHDDRHRSSAVDDPRRRSHSRARPRPASGRAAGTKRFSRRASSIAGCGSGWSSASRWTSR